MNKPIFTDIYSLLTENNEEIYNYSTGIEKIVAINYELLRNDFNFFKSMNNSDIDKYILETCMYITEKNYALKNKIIKNYEIIKKKIIKKSFQDFNIYRPINYGRSIVCVEKNKTNSLLNDLIKEIQKNEISYDNLLHHLKKSSDKSKDDYTKKTTHVDLLISKISKLKEKYTLLYNEFTQKINDDYKNNDLLSFDIKGVGLNTFYESIDNNVGEYSIRYINKLPTFEKGHSSGFISLHDCIHEYLFENIIYNITQKSKLLQYLNVSTIKSYCVIDTGLIDINGNKIGIYIRQPHKRYINEKNILNKESSLLIQSQYSLYGINTFQTGLYKLLSKNIQGTDNIKVVIDDEFWEKFNKNIKIDLEPIYIFDYGHYTMSSNIFADINQNVYKAEMDIYTKDKNSDIRNKYYNLPLFKDIYNLVKQNWQRCDIINQIKNKDNDLFRLFGKDIEDKSANKEAFTYCPIKKLWKENEYNKSKIGRMDLTLEKLNIDYIYTGLTPYLKNIEDPIIQRQSIEYTCKLLKDIIINDTCEVSICYNKEFYYNLLEYSKIHMLFINELYDKYKQTLVGGRNRDENFFNDNLYYLIKKQKYKYKYLKSREII